MPRQSKEPDDKEGFRWVLWKILGGESANLTDAAAKLHVHYNHLGNIISGRTRVTQRYIANKNWREILAAHYKDAWNKHGEEFGRRVTKLRPVGKRRIKEPENKDGFPWVLWKILGGANGDMTKAAALLGVHYNHLGNVIHGRKCVVQNYVKSKNWTDILAYNYPAAWRQYGRRFMQTLDSLAEKKGPNGQHATVSQPSDPGQGPAPRSEQELTEDWRRSAGAVLRHIREERGDDVSDITPCIKNTDLKRNYERLEKGDPALPAALFKTAAMEIKRVYYMNASAPELVELRGILDRAQKLAA